MILGPEFRLQSCLDAISDSAFGALELEGPGFIDWRVWGARTLVKPQTLNPQTANPAVGKGFADRTVSVIVITVF